MATRPVNARPYENLMFNSGAGLIEKLFQRLAPLQYSSQKINEPPHELHDMSVITAFPQNVAV